MPMNKKALAVALTIAGLISVTACSVDPSRSVTSNLNSDCVPTFRSFGAHPTMGTAPLDVTFSVELASSPEDCGATSLYWAIDGVTTAVTKANSHRIAFPMAGTFSVSVTAASEMLWAATAPITISVANPEGEARLSPLRTFARTREFETPTTTFSASSKITAEALVENPNFDDVLCGIGYEGASEAYFSLFENGSEKARSALGPVLWVESSVLFSPGESSLYTSTVNYWKTPTGSTFTMYPGVFTMAVVPKFYCKTAVQIEPHTIQVLP